jgi:hypothetical protein
VLDGLLPKQIFAGSRTFFDKSKACSRCFENSSRLTAGLKQVQSAFLALRRDVLVKNFLMTAQKCLGNSPLTGERDFHSDLSFLKNF